MPGTPEEVRSTGSHFLPRASPWVARLVAAAGLEEGESVLDAGAGAGSITVPLSEAVGPTGQVLAIEKDPDAAAALRRLALPNVRVVEADLLAVTWPKLDACVANPPFRLLPALLRRLLRHPVPRAVLVVPQELAGRLTAKPKEDAYGRLTVETGLRAKVQALFPMPRKAFDPPPAVPCAAIRLDCKPDPGVDEDLLAAVLDAAWAAKRRTLRHSLAPLAQVLKLPPQAITAALKATNAGSRTASEVSPWEYGELSKRVKEAVDARRA